jgi:hypothetical protein
LILVGVAAAQSSQGYDLACRGTVSVAGSVQTLPNSSIGLVSAVGQPGAGLVRSSNYGVQGGYVQPAARAGQHGQIAALDVDEVKFLPFIANTLASLVRPCVW